MSDCERCDGQGWQSVYVGGRGYTSRKCSACGGTGKTAERAVSIEP